MTPKEREARGIKAQAAMDEFFTPLFADVREQYRERIEQIATTEVNPKKRADKIAALATALKVAEQVEKGLLAFVADGKEAGKKALEARRVEEMSANRRRLYMIGR